MNADHLLGKTAKIRANPNELPAVTLDLTAQITNVNEYSGMLLLEFNCEVNISGREYSHVIASTRHVGVSPSILLTGRALMFSVIFVPSDCFNKNNPFDYSWWRGGAAMITDVLLV